MAVTVKSRAKSYAFNIAVRKLRMAKPFSSIDLKAIHAEARVTPSLLALARINLRREAAR